MRPTIRLPGMAALAAVALLVAGCSGSDATTDARGPAPSGSTPPATAAPPAAGTGGTASSAGPEVAPRPSAGCDAPDPADPPAGVSTPVSMSSAGRDRVYRRYVPPTLDRSQPAPLLLNLHGLTQPMDSQATVSGWEDVADAEGIVVLTPQGLGPVYSWAATLEPENPDTIFLGDLLDTAESELCIDLARVYANGISNGGLESSILACSLAHRIAAVGLVSGIVRPEGCAPSRPVPVIVFWGKQDAVLPFYGGLGPALKILTSPGADPGDLAPPTAPVHDESGVLPVEEVLATWAADNGCGAEPTVTQVSDHVELRTYTGCTDDATVELYVVADGGHTWPGSEAMATLGAAGEASRLIGKTTTEIEATPLMWAFFQQYALEG